MSGREYYRFLNSPEGRNRYFIDMGNVVLEATEDETRKYKAEQNHHYYIEAQEERKCILSFYALEEVNGCSGEELFADATQDVENNAIMHMEIHELQEALRQLDIESYKLINALYLADTRKTLRQLSRESGIPVMTLQDQKKKIFVYLRQTLLSKKFKKFPYKIQKSQQYKVRGQSKASLCTLTTEYPATE